MPLFKNPEVFLSIKNTQYYIVKREFYTKNTIDVAQKILGMYLIRKLGNTVLGGQVVETEAYLPYQDKASHGYRGQTLRNAVLFGEAGYTYVHSIHRYHCIDIVTEGSGKAGSVLIRAIKPIEGITIMKAFRNKNNIHELCSGPGKLCQALNIKKELNGTDVTAKNSEITIISNNNEINPNSIGNSARIGISQAKNLPLRFYLKNSLFVSRRS